MITIKEIAQKAGVSPTTVSNVLNGNLGKVSAKTREKVEVILREENYTPNMGAHILATKNSRIIGVIIYLEPRRNETPLEDPFFAAILGAIEVELRHHGYYMMLHSTCDKIEMLKLCSSWKLTGLILIGIPGSVMDDLKCKIQSPAVFIDSSVPEGEEESLSIGLEDRKGGFEIASYLMSMGHRKIVFLANQTLDSESDYNRFLGCREAFGREGYNLDEENFIFLSNKQSERFELYRRFSRRPFTHTALAFSADYYAVEAILFLQDKGVAIPEDLSVTGFDDNLYARIINPRLTTVRQDVSKKGRLAVDLLVAVINGNPPDQKKIRLPVELVVRDSVAPVKEDLSPGE